VILLELAFEHISKTF